MAEMKDVIYVRVQPGIKQRGEVLARESGQQMAEWVRSLIVAAITSQWAHPELRRCPSCHKVVPLDEAARVPLWHTHAGEIRRPW